VFERFSERARQVVVLAQEEARELRHNHIGTEHLLLGLLREDENGVAVRLLGEHGLELETVRAEVRRIVGEGDEVASDQIPFTPRAKKALELALREALGLGHNYIGPEHILLGLAREEEGVAAEIMVGAGLDAERIREFVVAAIPPQTPSVRRLRRPRRWQYRVELLGGLETAAALEGLGQEGWDLVAVIGEPGAYRGVFKRPA
jgi:ATP-dependent Clp protease ATP-binding subunit ClpA